MRASSAPISEASAEAPQAPQRPDQPTEFVLSDAERRLVCRSLASSHHALAQMKPHLRPNGEIAGINRLLRRLLGPHWSELAGTVRFRVK